LKSVPRVGAPRDALYAATRSGLQDGFVGDREPRRRGAGDGLRPQALRPFRGAPGGARGASPGGAGRRVARAEIRAACPFPHRNAAPGINQRL